jgi:hypothetical protein
MWMIFWITRLWLQSALKTAVIREGAERLKQSPDTGLNTWIATLKLKKGIFSVSPRNDSSI